MKNSKTISAELFIATGCLYCPVVMNGLGELLKNGELASLKITNIAVDSKRATELNIRSTPTFLLSNHKTSMLFAGNYNPTEIKKWVAIARSENGMREYIDSFLTDGKLAIVTQAIQLVPETFATIIALLEDEDTSMHIRIGLDALIENFSASDILKEYSPSLKKLASEDNMRLQIDALHYLALTADAENKAFLQDKTQHQNKQIQIAAIEALETLDDLIKNN